VCEFVAGLVAEEVAGGDGLLQGVHDVSGGGLGGALAEMAARSGTGARLEALGDPAELFCEAPGYFVAVTTRPEELVVRASQAGAFGRILGAAGGDRLVIEGLVDLSVADLVDAEEGALPRRLGEAV